MIIIRPGFNLHDAVTKTFEQGYFFNDNILTHTAQTALQTEIENLPLEIGDHITKPINENKPNQVKQRHERYYTEYGSPQTPTANMVIDSLSKAVKCIKKFPFLKQWKPNEIGYQLYRTENDFIGPHRDRSSDRLLSATFTIVGSAIIRIFEPIGNDKDYSNLRQIDEVMTSDGSLMLLKAPGWGDDIQTIHQVLPPITESRSILNLRMRSSILNQPHISI
ncbi:MAG: hypothetical protein NVSMB46_04730 [Candidatus Saccharimonadales bacterium]